MSTPAAQRSGWNARPGQHHVAAVRAAPQRRARRVEAEARAGGRAGRRGRPPSRGAARRRRGSTSASRSRPSRGRSARARCARRRPGPARSPRTRAPTAPRARRARSSRSTPIGCVRARRRSTARSRRPGVGHAVAGRGDELEVRERLARRRRDRRCARARRRRARRRPGSRGRSTSARGPCPSGDQRGTARKSATPPRSSAGRRDVACRRCRPRRGSASRLAPSSSVTTSSDSPSGDRRAGDVVVVVGDEPGQRAGADVEPGDAEVVAPGVGGDDRGLAPGAATAAEVAGVLAGVGELGASVPPSSSRTCELSAGRPGSRHQRAGARRGSRPAATAAPPTIPPPS